MMILQIYTHIPDILQPCIDSVKRYADRKNAEYIAIEKEKDSTYYHVEAWADKIQLEYEATNDYLLYADWDIMLCKDFDVGGDEPLFGDQHTNLVWTGARSNIFKAILDEYIKFEKSNINAKKARYRIWKMFNKNPIVKNKFNPNTYNHLMYSKGRS